jgi:hypothetical protein
MVVMCLMSQAYQRAGEVVHSARADLFELFFGDEDDYLCSSTMMSNA